MTHGLEIKLLNYFLLIAMAALMIGAEFVLEMNKVDLKTELWANISQAINSVSLEDESETVFAPLIKLRNKIVVMFGVLTVVVAIVLLMFIKNITTPLQKMVNVAQHINEGDLSRVVQVETRDEIGQLGMTINELTSNLQEVAAFTNQAGKQMIKKLEVQIGFVQTGQPPDLKELNLLKSDLESLSEFADSFKFLKTDLKKFG